VSQLEDGKCISNHKLEVASATVTLQVSSLPADKSYVLPLTRSLLSCWQFLSAALQQCGAEDVERVFQGDGHLVAMTEVSPSCAFLKKPAVGRSVACKPDFNRAIDDARAAEALGWSVIDCLEHSADKVSKFSVIFTPPPRRYWQQWQLTYLIHGQCIPVALHRMYRLCGPVN